MKWNIYDRDGKWLGTVRAASETQAVIAAQQQGMPGAHHAEQKDE